MFTYCLVTFLRSLLGLNFVEDGTCTLNATFVRPIASLVPQQSQAGNAEGPRKAGPARAGGEMQMMVDWHGDYDLWKNSDGAFAPASIPQDAFPDPTSPAEAEESAGSPPSTTAGVDEMMRLDRGIIPTPRYKLPYDPFHLDFQDLEDTRDRLYPVQAPPRTAQRSSPRRRRFGRCSLSEDCL
ncbi:hypothetical protein HYDPIDRAFT_28582 [Hydnomerulius pinastri MD-312]|uniref:Uncharacterized protein n=1 Tax=Hydnomerulius pinastri MD-312 TaxID=994086 RepID=A0A0C9VGF3_9AGAM|nr:hypothetical protein HYDPIDRAFT_28582 [Hydnomerulius pinastri MD-312]